MFRKYATIIIVLFLQACQFNRSNQTIKNSPFDIVSMSEKLTVMNISGSIDVKKITIPSQLHGSVDLSQLVDSIWYVPLETNHNSIIGKIDKVICYDSLIFVSDLQISKTVSIFSKEGKFIRNISNSGKGPGEYVYPEFFTVDKFNQTLEITDNSLHKVFIYDLLGNFKHSAPLKYRYNKYCKLQTGDFCIEAYNRLNEQWPKIQDYRIFISDSVFNLKKVGMGYNYSKSMKTAYGSPKFFSFHDKNPLITEPFNDSIFLVSGNKGLELKYILNFENFKKPEPRTNFESLSNYFEKYANDDEYAVFLGKFLKVENNIFIDLLHQGRSASIFYNVVNNSVVGGALMNMEKIKNALFFTPPISISDNAFISVLQSMDINALSREWKKNKDILEYRSNSIIEFASLIKAGDNPVLMFTKFKSGKKIVPKKNK